SHEAFVKEHVRFNGWFRANARSYEPPITLLDTTELSIEQSVSSLQAWIQTCLTKSGLATPSDRSRL
ncbi:MAG: hypothetical protein JXA74_17870, partial [Anaerolineae bacterium]|nr:hypothetical protein [Anaerolineae bacterium]